MMVTCLHSLSFSYPTHFVSAATGASVASVVRSCQVVRLRHAAVRIPDDLMSEPPSPEEFEELEHRVEELEHELETRDRVETVRWQSSWSILGWPLIAVAIGPNPERPDQRGHARGIIAVGDFAKGLFAVGGLASGGIAIGGLAVGLIAIGGLAAGGIAIGGCAVGGWSFAGVAVGWKATGGVAITPDL